MSIRVLDPTSGDAAGSARLQSRLTSIEGTRIGLLDNRKVGVRGLLDHMEDILRSRHGVGEIVRLKKPDASRPAPPTVIEEMKACQAVISAVGD